MIVFNTTRNSFVASRLKTANNAWERFRGLIGSRPLTEGEGFLIPLCKGIHTFGMGYAIDVLHLNERGQVLVALKSFSPNLLGPVVWKSKSVLELPTGAIERSHTQVGDFLTIEENPSDLLPEPVPVERSVLDRLGNVFFLNHFRFI